MDACTFSKPIKDQVIDCFLQWKAFTEKQSKWQLNTFRNDNGGEYTSKNFEKFLTYKGIWHKKTIPKTPEQNGVAVVNLRMFGCDAYTHVPKDERGNFGTKARKCLLLGYGEQIKGYRLYNIKERKVLYSRDIELKKNE